MMADSSVQSEVWLSLSIPGNGNRETRFPIFDVTGTSHTPPVGNSTATARPKAQTAGAQSQIGSGEACTCCMDMSFDRWDTDRKIQ